jgi:hypothetical protein
MRVLVASPSFRRDLGRCYIVDGLISGLEALYYATPKGLIGVVDILGYRY